MDMVARSKPEFEVGPMRADEVSVVARLHFDLIGVGESPGHSLAGLGRGFLERIFYRMNLDNPYFLVDVARYHGEIIGFCAYVSDRRRVFRQMIRRHWLALGWSLLRLIWQNPRGLRIILSNLRYVGGEKLTWLEQADAQSLLLAVKPEYRSQEFESLTGISVAWELKRFQSQVMKARGCRAWYTAVPSDNPASNRFQQRFGAQLVGSARAQGHELNYWYKSVSDKPRRGTM